MHNLNTIVQYQKTEQKKLAEKEVEILKANQSFF